MKIMVTGHRPLGIGGYQTPNPTEQWVRFTLRDLLEKLKSRRPELSAITGMALGVDMIFAEECHRAGIPYTAAVPSRGQESRWPEESQNRYQSILGRAVEVVYVDEDPKYASNSYGSKLYLRNKWMVDRAELVIAVWDGSEGGTGNCVKEALKADRKVICLDPQTRKVGPL